MLVQKFTRIKTIKNSTYISARKTSGSDISADAVPVDGVATSSCVVTNAGRSRTLVEVLVALLCGKRMSLRTSLGSTVEQSAVLVGFPWSEQEINLRGFHCVICVVG